MDPNDTSLYILVVVIGIVLTLVVGQVLLRAGRSFLRDVYGSEEDAKGPVFALGVLFHLVALGLLGTISTVPVIEVEGFVQNLVTRVGLVLLVLGALYAGTLYLLNRMRNKVRSQEIENEVNAQYQQQRRARQSSRQQIIEGGGGNSTGR